MLNIALVFLGVTAFGYSIVKLLSLLSLIKNLPLRKWWFSLLFLIIFFSLGYAAFGYLILSGSPFLTGRVMPSLVSFIFFFGSIFVVIAVSLIHITVASYEAQSFEVGQANRELEATRLDLETKAGERDLEIKKAKDALSELERVITLTTGREARMTDMKKEIDELKKKLGLV